VKPTTLEQRLAGLELLDIPVWVFDPDSFRYCWVNDRALELWRAASREELFQRDFTDASESARTRIENTLKSIREGRRVEEEWTFYPRGKPVTMRTHISPIELDTGRIGALFQAFVNERPDPEIVRGIEALRHTSVIVTLLDPRGEVLMRNPAAIRAFGDLTPAHEWYVDAGLMPVLIHELNAGRIFQTEALARTLMGERWLVIEARRATDPVTGQPAILIHQTDETARYAAERTSAAKSQMIEELNQTLSLVEQQRQQILALSAPVLEISESMLALPIIGALDRDRTAELSERLLRAISTRRARDVILDVTGADVLDASSAEYLIKLIRAIRLLGAHAIVTGVQPALALTLVNSGADLSGVRILRSLRQAIEASFGERKPRAQG
jgi:anti-anti-sigma regulatory factor/PAS domain-containing protein